MVTKATGVIADTICCSTGAYKHVKYIFYYKLFRIYQDYKKPLRTNQWQEVNVICRGVKCLNSDQLYPNRDQNKLRIIKPPMHNAYCDLE